MKKTYCRPNCNSIAIPTHLPLAASDASEGYRVNKYISADEEDLGGDDPY